MNTKLAQAFNKQINHEFYGAYLYFAMSTHFDETIMFEFSKFMRHHASRKLANAQYIYDYLILREEKLSFSDIIEPTVDWVNVSEIFSSALSHEEFMLNNAIEIYKLSKEQEDYGAIAFLNKIIEKQEMAVLQFKQMNYKIKNINSSNYNLEHICFNPEC